MGKEVCQKEIFVRERKFAGGKYSMGKKIDRRKIFSGERGEFSIDKNIGRRKIFHGNES